MKTSPAAPPEADAVGLAQVDPFRRDVLAGLTVRPKSIPCKYFYDERGSRLFDEITELEEYYPTRTELSIMERYVEEMVACLGPRCLLVEYGSGSSRKTRILLDHMTEPAGYVPIDISGEHLLASAARLREAFPNLEVRPVTADYTEPFDLPLDGPTADRTVVYFPGSTIGNFRPSSAELFLSRMAGVAGPGGGLLIGVDLDKDPTVLEAAYDDSKGITAAFNKNLLVRMNREIGAEFELETFHHEARYNIEESRVEMYLVSDRDQTVRVAAHPIEFQAGERIHTENSYKYTLDSFESIAESAGFSVRKVWTDDRRLFSVQYLEV